MLLALTKRLLITVTPRAKDKMTMLTTKGGQNKFLRLMVDSGGCHGFKYQFSLDSVNNVDDDHCVPGTSLLIDSLSMPFLKDSTIDWVEEPIKSSFRVINNSSTTTKGCGCGISFGIE